MENPFGSPRTVSQGVPKDVVPRAEVAALQRTYRLSAVALLCAMSLACYLSFAIGKESAGKPTPVPQRSFNPPIEPTDLVGQKPAKVRVPNLSVFEAKKWNTEIFDSLQGMKEVRFSVRADDEASRNADISQIRTKAELELQKIGVRITSNSSAPSLVLVVEVLLRKAREETPPDRMLLGDTAIYSCSLRVYESVEYARDGNLYRDVATIWEAATFGFAGSAVYREAIPSAIQSLLDRFSNDFLKANPR